MFFPSDKYFAINCHLVKKSKFWNSNRFVFKYFNYLKFTLFHFVTWVKGNKICPLLRDQDGIYKLWFRERFVAYASIPMLGIKTTDTLCKYMYYQSKPNS